MIALRIIYSLVSTKLASAGLVIGVSLLGISGWMWGQYATTKQVPNLPVATSALRLDHPLYSYSIYGVDQPLGVAVSPDGQRLYVTEGGGDRLVRILDPKGNPLGSFSAGDSKTGYRKPMYVAVSPEGLVYVTDMARQGIDIFSARGEYHTTLKPDFRQGENWQPLAMTFDKAGKLYVTDVYPDNQRVLVFRRDGSLERQITGSFAFANGIAVDGGGRIFVADSNNGRVQVFGAEGQPLQAFAEGAGGIKMALPRGLALDPQGRLGVVDTFNQSIQVFRTDPSPAFQFSLGEEGAGDGQFSYPNSLAVDGQGRMYVTDRENNRVQVWF